MNNHYEGQNQQYWPPKANTGKPFPARTLSALPPRALFLGAEGGVRRGFWTSRGRWSGCRARDALRRTGLESAVTSGSWRGRARKIPAAAEREEGRELLLLRRRQKLPAWCAERGRGGRGPGARRRVRCSGGPGGGAGRGSPGEPALCAVIPAGHVLLGERGRSRATSAGDAAGSPGSGPATCLARSGDQPGGPPRSGDGRSLRSLRAHPSRSILSVPLSAPLLRSFADAEPHSAADSPPTLPPRTPSLPSRVAPHSFPPSPAG
nr:laforin-like [Meriones unguiculatus]XP_021514560.1 laforin-like [Meriones unguiculatus]